MAHARNFANLEITAMIEAQCEYCASSLLLFHKLSANSWGCGKEETLPSS